jgi:hypothetical protein
MEQCTENGRNLIGHVDKMQEILPFLLFYPWSLQYNKNP